MARAVLLERRMKTFIARSAIVVGVLLLLGHAPAFALTPDFATCPDAGSCGPAVVDMGDHDDGTLARPDLPWGGIGDDIPGQDHGCALSGGHARSGAGFETLGLMAVLLTLAAGRRRRARAIFERA